MAFGVFLPIRSVDQDRGDSGNEYVLPSDDHIIVGTRFGCTIYSKGILCADQVLEHTAHVQTVLQNVGMPINEGQESM